MPWLLTEREVAGRVWLEDVEARPPWAAAALISVGAHDRHHRHLLAGAHAAAFSLAPGRRVSCNCNTNSTRTEHTLALSTRLATN